MHATTLAILLKCIACIYQKQFRDLHTHTYTYTDRHTQIESGSDLANLQTSRNNAGVESVLFSLNLLLYKYTNIYRIRNMYAYTYTNMLSLN